MVFLPRKPCGFGDSDIPTFWPVPYIIGVIGAPLSGDSSELGRLVAGNWGVLGLLRIGGSPAEACAIYPMMNSWGLYIGWLGDS